MFRSINVTFSCISTLANEVYIFKETYLPVYALGVINKCRSHVVVIWIRLNNGSYRPEECLTNVTKV